MVAGEDIISGEDSKHARRISILRESDGRCLGSVLVTPAEESTLTSRLGVQRSALERVSILSDLLVDPALAGEITPALVYLCCRRARISDRAVMMTALAGEPKATGRNSSTSLFGEFEPLSKLQPIEASGRTHVPVAQRVDILVHKAFTTTSERMIPFLHEQFVPEAVETLDRWIERFFRTSWFTSIQDGTMTKEQYVYTLSNLHQFVRWTTRLIGLAVSHSDDRTLRNKWLEHLQEEVNHEVIIEKDLAALGADVDYVVHHMVPNVANQQFMVTQESMIGFHADPVLFMGAPFVAEGFAARLDLRFIDSLRRVARSWGIESPKAVTAFLASHVEFDGGDDGHWEHTRRVLGTHLRTDTDLQKFLNVVRLAMNAFERSYTSYVDDLAIFGATPDKN